MKNAVLSTRDRLVWAAGFVIAAAAVILTRFTSQDPDSGLYAALAARLSLEPMSRWIAPEWWGLWTRTGVSGLYQDHPIGTFVLPALLARLGVPGVQASYVVGLAAGLAAILLIARFVNRFASRADARATLVLLQLMPVAFIFRVRANQEYLVLVCVLITLAGLDRVRRSWSGLAVVALGLTAAFLIKGAFVLFSLIAAAVWIVTNPSREKGSVLRPIVAVLAGFVATAGAALAYDAWYVRVTGQRFWAQYWQDQMSPVTIATPLDQAGTFAGHIVFYAVRLLWHPAPWSLILVFVAWRARARVVAFLSEGSSPARATLFVIGFAGLSVLALSPSSRVAERYVFSATYGIGAAGAVVTWRSWGAFRRAFEKADARIPGLPAVVWTTLVLLRLAAGPWLPRILWRP